MKKLIMILIVLALAAGAGATTHWYCDNSAAGGANGTSWINAYESFATITWGASGVKAGDTLDLSGGTTSQTYNEGLTIGASGTAGNTILVRTGQDAGHNGVVTINGGNYVRSLGIYLNGKSYVKVSGKVGTNKNIKVYNFADAGVDFEGTATNLEFEYLEVDSNGNSSDRHGFVGVLQYNSNYVSSIHDCYIHDNYQDGINIVQSSNGEASQFGSFLIYNNRIANICDDGMEFAIGADVYNNEIGPRISCGGIGHPDGFQFYNSYTKIYNNYIHGLVLTSDPGNSNSSIFFDPFDASITLNPKYVYIYNNLMVETQTPGTGDVHRGIAVKFAETGVLSADHIYVCNNTLVGIPFLGLTLTFASLGTAAVSDIVYENNIFENIGVSGAAIAAVETGNGTITYGSHGSGADVIFDYNDYYRSSVSYSNQVAVDANYYTITQFRAANSTEAHGIEVDPAFTGAYALSAGSGCINSAVTQTIFTTDKNSTTRYGAWDMGAYEYGEASPPATKKCTITLIGRGN